VAAFSGLFGDKMLLVALREHFTIDEEQEIDRRRI
jgi:hypothetical protein